MTTQVARDRDLPRLAGLGRSLPHSPDHYVRKRELPGIRTGQVITTQVAAVLLLLGAVGGPLALGSALFGAIVLLALTWLRPRGRWAFEWLGTALRFSTRDRAAALAFPVEPATLATTPAGVLTDAHGMTAVLELGNPASLLATDDPAGTPSPLALLPPAEPGHPPCRLQLLVTTAAALPPRSGADLAAVSYHQLTGGRLPCRGGSLLAVRVERTDGRSDEELRTALAGVVRRLLARTGPARPLAEPGLTGALAELTGGTGPTRETWAALRIGRTTQTTFRLTRWPADSARLVTRLLALPAAATTVALGAGPASPRRTGTTADLTIRLSAPDPAALAHAVHALHALLADEGAAARRLDGDHRDGLTATLPLALPIAPALPGHPGGKPLPAARADDLERLDVPLGTSGVMIGRNRHGDPVLLRLFRSEPTRLLLVGGLPCAQLLALRALAVGAEVLVRTDRPHAWEPFVRNLGPHSGPLTLTTAPRPALSPGPPPATTDPPEAHAEPLRALHQRPAATPRPATTEPPPPPPRTSRPEAPYLLVIDDDRGGNDPTGSGDPLPETRTTVVIRDGFRQGDVDQATRADLLLVQSLSSAEAGMLGTALGLGDTAGWLTRIRPDMLAVINRRAVRWAAVTPTPVEQRLIGPLTRIPARSDRG